MKGLVLGLAVGSAFAWTIPAHASGDISCAPEFKLDHRSRSDCDDMAFLNPANDTRTNLLLLMGLPGLKDRPPPHARTPLFGWQELAARIVGPAATDSLFADGDGSRCRSNEPGIIAFRQAVMSDPKLSEQERTLLVGARGSLAPTCAEGAATAASPADGLESRTGQEFGSYLAGTIAFYAGDFASAAQSFAAAARSRNEWLRETAAYMLGRTALNRAQVDAFDEYGTLKEPPAADRASLEQAERAFETYLRAYPRGRYAASAAGLRRRIWWLADDRAKLANAYAQALRQAAALGPAEKVALAEEIDDKLLARVDRRDVVDPTLLAVLDLRAMRSEEGAEQIGAAELEAQRPRFRDEPALFAFLRAAHAFYVQNAPDRALLALDAVPADHPTVGFTSRILRGMSLDASRPSEAASIWRQLLSSSGEQHQREAVELAYARHEERQGRVATLFEPGSPIATPVLRKRLLAYVAGADLLRAQARQGPTQDERELAALTLLYKELSRGRYAEFVQDLSLVPASVDTNIDGFYDVVWAERQPLHLLIKPRRGELDCPELRVTATTLAAAPGNQRAQLCLADFFRSNGFDEFPLDTDRPPADELGGTPSAFPGRPYARMNVYRAIIASKTAASEVRAYALYRAINCYAPSGVSSCGGEDAPKEVRRDWFRDLKTNYPQSRWAKSLRYYW